MDLIAEIKMRLKLEDLVRREFPDLRAAGRGQLVAHDKDGPKSLTVNVQKQLWSWWAEGSSAGQQCLGGDLFNWIAYRRFGRAKVDGEQFTEVLREGCALAGVEFEQDVSRRAAKAQRTALEREKRETLGKYMDVARSNWSPLALVQAKQRKRYLVKDVIERWELGIAPTWKQCADAGIPDKDLRTAGLLRDSTRNEGESYMHFKECIVIPWLDAGETVFISSRRLMDTDREGALLDKNKKSLSMHAPEADGTRGTIRPAAFNLDALRGGAGLFIVEGPLDAVACVEAGHAAIALGCKAPTDDLCKRLSYYPGITLYLALDGTDDVDAIERATAAGRLGLYTKVCELPEDKDPDDLSGEELAALQASAVDACDAWVQLIERKGAA